MEPDKGDVGDEENAEELPAAAACPREGNVAAAMALDH
jgi:hypothetical protein